MRKLVLTIGFLLAQSTLPATLPAQAAGPLHKSDLVRLLASSRGSTGPIVNLVKERCLAFSPTERDREDLMALGAGSPLMDAIGGCETRKTASASGSAKSASVAGARPALAAAPKPAAEPPVEEVELAPPPVGSGPPASGTHASPSAPIIDRPPVMTNAAEVARRLKQHYPADLLRRGVGGKVVLRLLVDLEGRVRETEVAEPSAEPGLDEAAVRVAAHMRFEPARAGDTPISTWMRQPVVFSAR